MTRFRRETRIDAPLDEVWSFHSGIEALTAITPGWLGLRIESIDAPGGGDELVEGTAIDLAMRPFGIGPAVRWRARITGRHRDENEAWFRDEQVDGPFERWVHTHQFRADDGATRLIDHVEFELSRLGRASWLVKPGLAMAFRDRHRRTRRLLEA